MTQQEQITVLVHGTFANVAPKPGKPPLPRWWKVSEPGLTAERLRAALREHDPSLAETVWEEGRDPRDGDMKYEDLVEWSSANKHKDRVKAAKQLTASLNTLADRRGCTPEAPLHVNYVAHSHGGNVVLESLKHVERGGKLKPRQVNLLGTPLTWQYPDPRIGYLTILLLFVAGWIVGDVQYLFQGGREADPDALSLPEEIILSIVLLIGLFWAAFGVIRLLRRFFDGQPGKPAYGPPPEELKEILGPRPVVLFISDEDEADLMLQLGAAPLDTYRALIRGRPALEGGFGQRAIRLPLRFIEMFFIRPFSYAIVVPLMEILLERFGLGFPFRSVMIHNYEMMTWTKRPLYGQAIMKVQIEADELEKGQSDAADLLKQLSETTNAPAPALHEVGEDLTERERIAQLRETLLETLGGLTSQVHLSHSGYYQAQRIIDEVAGVIAAPDAQVETITIDLNAAHQEPPAAVPGQTQASPS